MGNNNSSNDNSNNSTGKKILGGFLMGSGVALAYTPVGPITSPWLIPLGANVAGISDEPIGVSASYADDGQGVKLHVGCPKTIDSEREYIRQKQEFEKINKHVARERIKIMNDTIHTDLNKHIIDTLKDKIMNIQKCETICTYDFVTTREVNSIILNHFNDIILVSSCEAKPTEDYVDSIYVARRNLSKLPFKVGVLAHSGLLIKTNQNKYYVLEYGVEKNKTSCNEISFVFDDWFYMGSQKWNKQQHGAQLNKKITVHELQQLMNKNVGKSTYNMLMFNCHMAQEQLRIDLELKVKNPYIKELLEEELTYMIMMDTI